MMYAAVRREMERYFGMDARRIAHALEVASHARAIQAAEGGDRDIVTMAALLHDVGITPAEKRYGSSAGRLQEELGPPIAAEILERLGVEADRIASVKDLIAHHHTPGKIATKEFACLWDADFIVNLREVAPEMSLGRLRFVIDGKFMTDEGRRIAREIHLSSSPRRRRPREGGLPP